MKNVDDLKFWQKSTTSNCFQCILASPLPYSSLYCGIWRWLLEATFFMLRPLTSSAICRTECCQKQTDELKKELKPFIQLSEHIACHLCATFPHGQCLAAPDSHPAPANHRTWPWAAGLMLREALGVNVWDRASTRCLGCTCLSLSLSLCDYTISILIDVPMGFGWTQLCRRRYTLETISKSWP